jgi:osmotically-inducible protein OsmY
MLKPIYGLTGALILAAALPGCAYFQNGRECGSGGCAADARVTTDVQRSLDRHAELGPPGQIQVTSLNHVVYLYGTVTGDFERSIAKSVALEASGDARIVNSIAVGEK